MVAPVTTAYIHLWGIRVGAVLWHDEHEYASFEYDPDFLKSGIEVSPFLMSVDDAWRGSGIFSFRNLNKDTFRGLPGLLADSLPDKFGNAIIDAWLARNGRTVSSFSSVERLCYIGTRGMGALEFTPPINNRIEQSVSVEVAELMMLAQEVMTHRNKLTADLIGGEQDADALLEILRVGTSAGGARPKAIIAMDEHGNVRSGQTEAPEGYDYWLLKFDGVQDMELGKPANYGRVEYAYYLMVQAAGIEMSESRLLEENGRAHFITKRFDRVAGQKVHMQSLCGIAHYDFNLPGAYSYEQAFAVMRQLRLSKSETIQQYLRMVMCVLGRNQDDHCKNIAFLMGQDGVWRLSPAFDMTYSHNPAGKWTNQHQMTINGKRDKFELDDLVTVGESIGIRKPLQYIDQVSQAVSKWSDFAETAGLSEETIKRIARNHRKFRI